MKLYDFKMAPNPRRVVMLSVEKGLEMDRVSVDTTRKEQLTAAYTEINPFQQIPALELDDGTVLTESVAICQYLEGLHPEPNLLGRTPLEQATVTMWERRMEAFGLSAVAEAFRNSLPFYAGRALSGAGPLEQIPELAVRGRVRVGRFFQMLNGVLSDREFLALDRFTLADITGFIAVDFARIIKMRPSEDQTNLIRWYKSIQSRPSAAA